MDREARLGDLNLLKSLDSSFMKFKESAKKILHDFDLVVKKNIELLISRQEYWLGRIKYWERVIEDADEDTDLRHAYKKLKEAEGNLREIDNWLNEVKDNLNNCVRYEKIFTEFVENKMPKLSHFLNRKYEESSAYWSSKEISAESYGNISFSKTEHIAQKKDDEFQNFPISLFVLPDGFKWINVNEIDQTFLPSSSANFTGHASYESIKECFKRLTQDLLPLLQVDPNLSIDYIRQIDMQNSVDYANSLERVYNMFFSRSEPVYLTKRIGDAKYSVTNGLHRIKVAIDLGFSHVPAIAVETRGNI